jgi:hypothetical protein
MPADPFVPDGFEPPQALALADLHLVPLGPEHNESDHAAWTSSVAHIRATPASRRSHGRPRTACRSRRISRTWSGTARDFEERTGFTYTVLAPATDEVIGCV